MSSHRHPQVTRPKRPLSSYNLFFMDNRKRLLRALAPDDSTLGANRVSQQIEEVNSKRFEVRIKDKSDEQTETPEPGRKRKVGRPRGPNYKPRKKHGAFGFSQLASMVACDWKNLEQSLKKPYEDQATVQLKSYREAMLEYKKTVEKLKKETNGMCQNESIDSANNYGDKQRSQPSKVSFSTPLPPAKSLTSPSRQHLHNVPLASFLVEHDPFSDSSCSEEPDSIRASPSRPFTPPCIYDWINQTVSCG